MKKNKTKAKLKRGEVAIGHFILEFDTPGIGQIMANAGCDFAILDMEHSSLTQNSIRWSILSAKAAGVSPVVRVPYTEYFFMSRALDAGAEGLMIPRVETREQTLKIIDSMKYPPMGNRGAAFGIMDAIGRYLQDSEEGTTTELYGYALHVQVIGMKQGKNTEYILTHTHPSSDGSVPGWEKLRAYTRCVGIPLAIAVDCIARGKFDGTGVVIPEYAFDPHEVFKELEKRRIFMHVEEKEAEEG